MADEKDQDFQNEDEVERDSAVAGENEESSTAETELSSADVSGAADEAPGKVPEVGSSEVSVPEAIPVESGDSGSETQSDGDTSGVLKSLFVLLLLGMLLVLAFMFFSGTEVEVKDNVNSEPASNEATVAPGPNQ